MHNFLTGETTITAQQQPTVSTLFTAYIARRNSGLSMDEVVQALQDAAYLLPRDERHQLGKMVQDWEAKQAAAPVQEAPKPPVERQTPQLQRLPNAAPPEASQPVQQKPKGPALFGTRFLDPSKLPGAAPVIRPLDNTPAKESRICGKCGKPNKATEPYCYACGHIMETSDAMTKPLEKMDGKTRWGTAHFAHLDTLKLSIRGFSNPLEVHLKQEMIIGRASAKSPLRPDIDLKDYNAEQLGVSRLHAAFRRQDETVVLVDMGSANKTFINGQRVYPHEVRVVRSGDEIRLGKMTIKVTFNHT